MVKLKQKFYKFLPTAGRSLNSDSSSKFVGMPYISLRALKYKFFRGTPDILEYQSLKYSDSDADEISNAEKQSSILDKQNLENFPKRVNQASAALKDQIKDDSNKNFEDKTAENSVTPENTKKQILSTIILPVQGGMIESLQNNWSSQNNMRLGLGLNFRDPVATAKSMAVLTKRYLLSDLINSAFKDLWKMGLHTAGEAFNEYVDIVYSNPEFRTFRFSFDLYPESAAEANELKKIIFILKYFSSPKSDVGLTIKYPAMWEIDITAPNFRKQNRENKRLMMVYYCALRNITVNYDNNGTISFHDDGEPVKNHIELEFQELTYLTRDLLDFEAQQLGIGDIFG